MRRTRRTRWASGACSHRRRLTRSVDCCSAAAAAAAAAAAGAAVAVAVVVVVCGADPPGN